MLDEPLDDALARDLIRQILVSGKLGFSGHAYEEIEDDELVEQDVRNCLRAGWYDGWDLRSGSYRYRIRTNEMTVVLAFRSEDHAVVVTAWRHG